MDIRNIILVDDKPSFRNTTKLLLRKIGNNKVVAEYSCGEDFLADIDNIEADIIFMDIEMPGINGIETTKRALKKRPNLLIIGLSLYDEPTYIDKLIEVGAKGYLLKLSDNYSLIDTILKYPTSEIFYSEEIAPDYAKKESVKKKILIVDDVDGTRFILEYTLQNQGYDVVSYSSAQEAIKNISEIKPDLIISDYYMPDIDGIEFVSKIRNISDLENTPIILLSIKIDNEIQTQCNQLKITSIIKKPFTGKKLIEAVENVMI
ncbi:MAG: response regulator [Bacteroidales bacterium]|nr:response regulator [Bacteroidales bacterium]